MSVTIQVRRDLAANWTSTNPVLHQGEIGLETDTGKGKMGDGATAWASLAYWQPSGADVDNFLQIANNLSDVPSASTARKNLRAAAQSSPRRKSRYAAAVSTTGSLAVSTTGITGAHFTPAATSSVVNANPPWRLEGASVYAPFSTSAFVEPKFAGTNQPVPFRVSFDFYGAQFAAQVFGTDYEFQVYINDLPLLAAPYVMPNDSLTYWAIVTLPGLAQYRVTIELSAGPAPTVYFGGIAALPTYDVRPPADPSPLRMVVVGDSYGCGKGAGNISSSPNAYSILGYVPQLSKLLGIPDTWTMSIGGTGYVAGTSPYSARSADVIAAAPDVVIVQGSINDGGQSGVQAAATSFLSGLQSALPNATIIVTGPLYAAAYVGNYTTAAASMQAAATALNIPFVDASTWATGTGNFGTPNGSGTSDFYLNNDSVHPTAAGHLMIASRLAAALAPILGIDAGEEPAPAPGLAPVQATPAAGYALVNGTGTIISWTAPNDGAIHRFTVYTDMHVTSAETGGGVSVAFTLPDGFATSHTLYNANATAGDNGQASVYTRLIQAGSTVTISQSTALTAGAAVVWAEIWAL